MDRVNSFTQAYSQAPWRKQMQIVGLFLLVLVFGALVAGIYLSVTARAAAIGREIQGLQNDVLAIKQENENLRGQLAQISSAAEMEARAQAMGFQRVNVDETLYLRVPGYTGRPSVVLAPVTREALTSAPVLPAEYTESLFDWLGRQVLQSSFLLVEVSR